METITFWIGAIECRIVRYGRGTGTPEWLFPDIPAEDLGEVMTPYVDEDGELEFVFSSVLVRSGDRVALLDTGFSDDPTRLPAPLQAALRSASLTPEDVDTVVISHGHADHIGGLTTVTKGKSDVSFPAARHFVHADEFDHWTGPRGAGAPDDPAGKLRPLEVASVLELVDGEREVLPGVRLLPTPGHTPGHLAVAVTSRGHGGLFVGDALAHEVNVPHPDWNHFSDMLPGPSIKSRRMLVERAARDGHLLIASHMPKIGRVMVNPAGVRRFSSESVGADVGGTQ